MNRLFYGLQRVATEYLYKKGHDIGYKHKQVSHKSHSFCFFRAFEGESEKTASLIANATTLFEALGACESYLKNNENSSFSRLIINEIQGHTSSMSGKEYKFDPGWQKDYAYTSWNIGYDSYRDSLMTIKRLLSNLSDTNYQLQTKEPCNTKAPQSKSLAH